MTFTSPDDIVASLHTTVVAPSDLATILTTNLPTESLTATLLSVSTQSGTLQLVYGAIAGSANPAPPSVTFTRLGPSVAATATNTPSSSLGASSNSTISNVSVPLDHDGSSTPSSEFDSSTGTPPPGKEKGNGKSTIAPREVAGIAIGCAIFGAIIAASAAILYYKRRARKTATVMVADHEQITRLPRSDGKASRFNIETSESTETTRPTNTLAITLPPPRQDRDIRDEFSKLGNSIRNHAQSFYGNKGTRSESTIDMSLLACLLGQRPRTRYDADTIAGLLDNPLTRVSGVRLLLASVIIVGIDPGCSADCTLLPPEIAQCTRVLEQASTGMQQRTLLLSKWRQITGTLTKSMYGHKHIAPGDPRLVNIERIAIDLDSLLKPFASTNPDDVRKGNMVEILKRGASFGNILLTQATEWTFDWVSGNSKSSPARVVLLPALVQTVDDQGVVRQAPIRMSDTEESILLR